MSGDLIVRMTDPSFLFGVFVAIATSASVITVGLPLLESDNLSKRMKAVATEREKIRARERDRLSRSKKVGLRQEPKAFMKQIVDQFSLTKWLGTETAKLQLARAGYRGSQAEVAFLFFRLVTPLVMFLITSLYVFVILDLPYPVSIKFGMALASTYIGIKAPEVYLKNKTSKRQSSMRKAFPDALDLLLICVESGMSIDHAFGKVSQEIGVQSVALAEEMTLTMAELSYLPDRRIALENLAARAPLESIRQIVTVLIQAERYGTPLGAALRVAAQESRDSRLMEAEKKAAALPPKLTVPMILFFLPVLFAVILTPAIIQVMAVHK